MVRCMKAPIVNNFERRFGLYIVSVVENDYDATHEAVAIWAEVWRLVEDQAIYRNWPYQIS